MTRTKKIILAGLVSAGLVLGLGAAAAGSGGAGGTSAMAPAVFYHS